MQHSRQAMFQTGFKKHTNLLVLPFRFCHFVLDVVRRETLHLSGSMNLLDITIHSFLRLAASQGFVFPARSGSWSKDRSKC
ncbi:hypothetical protein CHARACLAT_025210 [Characodon lateralis]|uniref:Uncharacterized protein n=1 Tax=Characodon lateralis TaxID=208331 RepID=A0ABU7EXN2_9TELE|nr:hypothetical protein [Characodon lateralis]